MVVWGVVCFDRFDGIAAAALVLRLARLKGVSCRSVHFVNYHNVREVLLEISKGEGVAWFFLDFSPEQIVDVEKVVKRIAENNMVAYWSTHHACSDAVQQSIVPFVKVVDFTTVKEGKLCATELVQQRFFPRDVVARELKNIAHAVEFWTRENNRAEMLADIVASGFDKRRLAEDLSKGALWSPEYERLRGEYVEKKLRALVDVQKSVVKKEYVGKVFGFCLVPSLLSSADAGQAVLESSGEIVVSVCVFRDGRVSFRRKNECDVDVLELAKLFGGGGYVFASGGFVAEVFHVVSQENFNDVLFFIDQKIKSVLLK